MDTYIKELEEALKGTTSKFKEEVRGIRSNRPSVESLEDIPVMAYGQMMSIKQLGSLSVGSQREIQISVWDKSVIGPITGAIQDAKLGFSLQNEGNIIRAFLPSLSSERREELMKQAKKTSEEFRVQVRSRRDDTMKKLKSAEDVGELTEDDLASAKKKVQDLTDKANGEIEKTLEAKIKEIQE